VTFDGRTTVCAICEVRKPINLRPFEYGSAFSPPPPRAPVTTHCTYSTRDKSSEFVYRPRTNDTRSDITPTGEVRAPNRDNAHYALTIRARVAEFNGIGVRRVSRLPYLISKPHVSHTDDDESNQRIIITTTITNAISIRAVVPVAGGVRQRNYVFLLRPRQTCTNPCTRVKCNVLHRAVSLAKSVAAAADFTPSPIDRKPYRNNNNNNNDIQKHVVVITIPTRQQLHNVCYTVSNTRVTVSFSSTGVRSAVRRRNGREKRPLLQYRLVKGKSG
jgi:hypothetical protein